MLPLATAATNEPREIKAVMERVASIAAVISDADPAAKGHIYRGLNVVVTYQPGAQTVRAAAHLSGTNPAAHGRGHDSDQWE
jgi:hypothetical protein